MTITSKDTNLSQQEIYYCLNFLSLWPPIALLLESMLNYNYESVFGRIVP